MRFDRLAIIGLVAVLLAACGGKGEVYDRPTDQVRDLLRTIEVPLYVFGNSADTNAVLDASDPAKLVWKVTANDSNVLKFIVTLTPEDETKTRVIVDVEGSRQGNFGDVEARLTKLPSVRNFYLVTMTEAVDSTLDGRRFDITATYPAMMSAAAANANRLFPPDKSGTNPSRS